MDNYILNVLLVQQFCHVAGKNMKTHEIPSQVITIC